MPWRRNRSFACERSGAILPRCPGPTPAWACCPTISTSSRSPGRASGARPSTTVEAWTVTDDWPNPVPISDAELDVFEAWFGDLFDELFGSCR